MSSSRTLMPPIPFTDNELRITSPKSTLDRDVFAKIFLPSAAIFD